MHIVRPLLLTCAFLSACRVGQTGLFETCESTEVRESSWESGAPILSGISARNVLMISIDTLRRDRIGRYSCERLSPFIDQLLEQSLVLDNHHSCSSWTLPSAICVLTGQTPVDLGAFPQVNSKQEVPKIAETTATLAGQLSQAGLSTLLVSSNLYISGKSGLDVGYDRVITKRKPSNILLTTILNELDSFENADPDKPWFAHVHLIDPHTPYSPPGSYLSSIDDLPEIPWDLSNADGTREMNEAWPDLSSAERSEVGKHLVYRYGAEIRYMNDELETFFAELESRGILENTLVVLWSDHGEQFWEHGDWGHGISLHAGENRAIAALSGPGIEAGSWTFPTTHTDLAPTILGALDLPLPEEWRGAPVGLHDHSRALFAATAPREADVQQSILLDNHRLLYRWDGEKLLYNVKDDPHETTDLYRSQPERVAELWAEFEEELNRLVALFPDKTPPVDPGP